MRINKNKGYAKGGRISQDALDLADIAASGAPVAADPEMIQAALDSMNKGPSQDAKDLADIAASGMPIAADPEMLDAGLKEERGYAKGGKVTAGLGGIEQNPNPEPPPMERGTAGLDGVGYDEGGMVDDDKDPSILPEDIKELIKMVHKEQIESRPDENWTIRGAPKPDPIAPYRKNEDEEEEADDEPGYAVGGMVDADPNQLLQDIAPPGVGTLTPSPAAPPVQPPDTAMVPPPVPKAPIVPHATPPAPTDADFMNRANKMMGLNPQEQAGFMKLLGDKSQTGQIGAGVAGIGDAIASGGTLGKVNPGGLAKSEDIINNKEKSGIEGMQTIRGNQEKVTDLSLKLQAQDPNSPLSKYAQKAYADLGKKLGMDLSHASASIIGDLTGKGVSALNDEAELALKQAALGLQSKQVDATIANQKSEREIAEAGRRSEAAKALSNRGYLDTAAGFIPGTAANAAKHTLQDEMSIGKHSPDVTSYAQRHGITPEEAQKVKDKRTGGK